MTDPRPKARKILAISRITMVVAALAMIVTTMLAYPLADRIGFGVQIAAHLLLPISAALFKIGYVVRLASHHTLGNFSAG
ncbi:hypothetical protein [Cognatazoarcus halotolerans]|uniref:hypothetical protein n=1 Tax=Cognatazoarcus halotolerans TaxID=2686016 RepID=UPI001358A535|nr:hypothetical protein [Cognatazoarcus halotolerans]MBX3678564.1 hypothetical protein [Rhodocyclaceae bacterium]MCB1898840.1 hypothetical protein [Rhodocyclaceae bacterium]MCP5308523.1 hypothetical protein [Zoogloeaceae bacterium]